MWAQRRNREAVCHAVPGCDWLKDGNIEQLFTVWPRCKSKLRNKPKQRCDAASLHHSGSILVLPSPAIGAPPFERDHLSFITVAPHFNRLFYHGSHKKKTPCRPRSGDPKHAFLCFISLKSLDSNPSPVRSGDKFECFYITRYVPALKLE